MEWSCRIKQLVERNVFVMKKVLVMITVLCLSIGLYGCGAADDDEENEEVNQEEQELVLGLTTWTSTIPPTEVVIDILEDMGYQIEVEEADIGVIYAGLAKDRKSTRLNSSHVAISYAVFC